MELKLLKLPQIINLKDLKANQFWVVGRSLAETITESGELDCVFVCGFFSCKTALIV